MMKLPFQLDHPAVHDCLLRLLEGENQLLELVRKQFLCVTGIAKQEFTVKGYFIEFEFNSQINKYALPGKYKNLSGVGDVEIIFNTDGTEESNPELIGQIMLFFKDGIVDFVEFFMFGNSMPKTYKGYRIRHYTNPRNIQEMFDSCVVS